MQSSKPEPTTMVVPATKRVVTLTIGEPYPIHENRQTQIRVVGMPRGRGSRVLVEVTEATVVNSEGSKT